MHSGLAAFVYVAALWYIAPAFLREGGGIADRLRTLLVLGIAVPGGLALVHLLYAPLLWAVVALLAIWRVRKSSPPIAHDPWLYAVFAGALLILWPPLVRPLLDGDTLLYHLPNAFAFVQTHSLWTAQAPYWLYPPASELFASGLLAASGRWSLPLAGILPALLITARIYTAARARGAGAFCAAGVALAFICTPVAALQAGTLQNDLWLAAFFVEVLEGDRSPIALAVCVLLKPYGWLLGLLAAVTARVPWRAVAIAFVPLALWIARDVLLLREGASLGFSTPRYFTTTIAGSAAIALPQLAHGIAAVTPQAFVWIAALVAGPFFPASRRYAAAGAVAFLLYVFLPVSYTNGVTNYALDASSLRYALPALAAGALALAILLARASVWTSVFAYLLAAWGAWSVLAIFWNDSYTHWAIAAALVTLAASLAAKVTRSISIATVALALMLAGSWGASTRAQSFYADWMRQPLGKATGVFAWITQHAPERVIAENVRTGALLMSSPRTWTVAGAPGQECAEARREHALLLVGSNEDLDPADLARAFGDARSCGSTLYEDGAAIVVQPR